MEYDFKPLPEDNPNVRYKPKVKVYKHFNHGGTWRRISEAADLYDSRVGAADQIRNNESMIIHNILVAFSAAFERGEVVERNEHYAFACNMHSIGRMCRYKGKGDLSRSVKMNLPNIKAAGIITDATVEEMKLLRQALRADDQRDTFAYSYISIPKKFIEFYERRFEN